MSVECRILVGLTLEFARDLQYKDFRKIETFTEKHPELDEYNYHRDSREGKLLLIGDGMNGEFLRLIKVDKCIDDGYIGDSNEFVELPAPSQSFNAELIHTMSELYEEYTGKPATFADFKYAMWSQWR